MFRNYYIGIDLGGTNFRTALLDRNFKIVDKRVTGTRQFHAKAALIEAIVESVRALILKNNLKKSNVLGVGLGLPGPIDFERGIVHFFPNIPGWKRVNLKKILQARLGLRVYLDNDANLMSLAECEFGAAKGFRYVVCLTLGTGVGGGIVFCGNLFRGKSNITAEIGHLPINEAGPRCNCGGSGCLERYIGNNRIAERIRQVFKRDISLEELSRMAKNNNRSALKIWNEVGSHLGVALTGVINLLNPDCIVIGGGVANAGAFLFKRVRQVIRERAMPVQARDAKIFKARLGIDAGVIGAALLVNKEVGHEDIH